MKERKGIEVRKQSLRKTIYKKNKLRFCVSMIFILLNCLVNIYLAFFLKRVIDATTLGNLDQVKKIIIETAIIISGFIITGIIGKFVRARYIKQGITNYKDAIIKAILKKELKQFRSSNTGSYISMLTNDINIIQSDYINGTLDLIAQIMMFIAGLISMIAINVRMLIIVVFVSFIPMIISSLFGKSINNRMSAFSKSNDKYTALIKDIFSGFTVIKSFHVESEIYKVEEKNNCEVEGNRCKHYVLTEVLGILLGATSFLVVIVTFSIGGIFVIKGILTIGSLMAFVQLLNFLLGPIQKIGEGMNRIKAAKGILSKIDDIVNQFSEDISDVITKKSFNKDLVIDNLSFEYEDGNVVLDHVSTKFEKTKSYAIIGSSGSGKSTLIKILLGYYGNYRGNISIDGVDIQNIDKASLYELMSVVQQDVFMFDDSIKNNIALYKDYTEEEINKVAILAGMKDFIDIKGIEYKCGENGNALSGGQNQRISIARALIKNTPILIMDEAMASLDYQTAANLEKQIQGIKDMTRIVVTHNISEELLRGYDELILMRDGRIVAQGSLDKLMEGKDNLFSLFQLGDFQ